MASKIKTAPSGALVFMRCSILFLITAICIFSYFGLVDPRTKEEKAADELEEFLNEEYSKEVIAHLKNVLKHQQNYPTQFEITDVFYIRSKTKGKAVLFKTRSGDEYCFYSSGTEKYSASNPTIYDYLKHETLVIKSHYFDAEELKILFEEAEKQ